MSTGNDFRSRLARAIEKSNERGDHAQAEVLKRILMGASPSGPVAGPDPVKTKSGYGTTYTRAKSPSPDPEVPADEAQIDSKESEKHEPDEREPSRPEEGEMSEDQERSAARNTLSVLARAGVHGTKVAAAAAANKELVDLVEGLLGEHYPDLMRTKVGRPVAELITPLVLLQLSNMFPERIPKVEHVQKGCELALEAVSRDSLEPLMRAIVPLSGKMAKIGAQYMSDSVQKARSSRDPAIEQIIEDADEIDEKGMEKLREEARRYREGLASE